MMRKTNRLQNGQLITNLMEGRPGHCMQVPAALEQARERHWALVGNLEAFSIPVVVIVLINAAKHKPRRTAGRRICLAEDYFL